MGIAQEDRVNAVSNQKFNRKQVSKSSEIDGLKVPGLSNVSHGFGEA